MHGLCEEWHHSIDIQFPPLSKLPVHFQPCASESVRVYSTRITVDMCVQNQQVMRNIAELTSVTIESSRYYDNVERKFNIHTPVAVLCIEYFVVVWCVMV